MRFACPARVTEANVLAAAIALIASLDSFLDYLAVCLHCSHCRGGCSTAAISLMLRPQNCARKQVRRALLYWHEMRLARQQHVAADQAQDCARGDGADEAGADSAASAARLSRKAPFSDQGLKKCVKCHTYVQRAAGGGESGGLRDECCAGCFEMLVLEQQEASCVAAQRERGWAWVEEADGEEGAGGENAGGWWKKMLPFQRHQRGDEVGSDRDVDDEDGEGEDVLPKEEYADQSLNRPSPPLRDRVGRIVVEDGLQRMQHPLSVHAQGLAGLTGPGRQPAGSVGSVGSDGGGAVGGGHRRADLTWLRKHVIDDAGDECCELLLMSHKPVFRESAVPCRVWACVAAGVHSHACSRSSLASRHAPPLAPCPRVTLKAEGV